MGLFNWLFRKPAPPGPTSTGLKRYEYPTGNVELAIRVESGEFIKKVMADIHPRWTPGNEYLWDEYDLESLLDTPEKRQYMVNALLFGRLTVYRALRAAGKDIRGRDPFEFTAQVPEVVAGLAVRFPNVFGDEPRPRLNLQAHELKLSPGDPGLEADKSRGQVD
jgi:hypothetical protein